MRLQKLAGLERQKIEDELIAIQMEKLQKPNAEEVISVAEEKTVAAVKSEIVYDDFAKLDIRVATIIAAEKVKKADSAKTSLFIVDEAHRFITNVYNNIYNLL